MLLSGRKALVFGYGDVGKGSAMSLRQEGMVVKITEIDLFAPCRLVWMVMKLFRLM